MFGADTRALFANVAQILKFACLKKYFQKNKSQFSNSRSFKPPLTNYFYFGFWYNLSGL